jgi:predicted RNase H-like HicB family nuclease
MKTTEIIVNIYWSDNYGACANDILGCVATAGTLEEIKDNYASALQFHLEGMRLYNYEIPPCLIGNYRLVYNLNAQAFLKCVSETLSPNKIAHVSGISEKRICQYISGKRIMGEEQSARILTAIQLLGFEKSAYESRDLKEGLFS